MQNENLLSSYKQVLGALELGLFPGAVATELAQAKGFIRQIITHIEAVNEGSRDQEDTRRVASSDTASGPQDERDQGDQDK